MGANARGEIGRHKRTALTRGSQIADHPRRSELREQQSLLCESASYLPPPAGLSVRQSRMPDAETLRLSAERAAPHVSSLGIYKWPPLQGDHLHIRGLF
jgi:hypothetical protein